MRTSSILPVFSFLLVLLLFPCPAWALQTHIAPEGLYVHQLAHIQFIFALGYLFWDIRRSFFTSKGWIHLQVFCVLMIIWNIIAFTGHASDVVLDADHISSEAGYLFSHLLGPLTFNKVAFYFAKLDHLLLAPALFFLFIGMRSFYRNVDGQIERKKK